MRFKDLKLGKKLGIGFGVLILIATILGLTAVFNMQSISDNSEYLANEYVPEVELANSIERSSLQTMYNMRGYGFTEEKQFLTSSRNTLQSTQRYLEQAEELANKSTQLEMLKELIISTQTSVNDYERLVEQTVELNDNLEKLRIKMDDEARQFVSSCMLYLNNQNSVLKSDAEAGAMQSVISRNEKITAINDIIDAGNALRIANFKAQATRDPDAYEKAINNFDISQTINSLRNKTSSSINISQLNNVEGAANEYKDAMISFLGVWKERELINKERDVAGQKVLTNTEEISKAGIQNTQKTANDAVDLLGASSMVMIIGLIAALLIGILLAVYLTNLITTPIKEGVSFAKTIAEGNLNAKINVEQKDEIGELSLALTDMVEKLKNIVTNIISGSDNIASASSEMSGTSQQMSQGANEQASSAEEVSSSMEEMNANIQQNTDNASETEKIAIKASEGIRKGNEASQKSVESMKDIAQKISIINDIAFQTNILALNAAVEAARAGEHGKGFAVVAAEVRKLAERSAKAAKEIDDVSREGVIVSENAGKLLSEIVPEIEKTSRLVQEISASSVEQTSGANQVNTAIQQLNQVTQQNAAAAEEMATSAEELSSQAEQLKDVVDYFKVDLSGIKKINFDKKQSKLKSKISHLNSDKKDTTGVKLDLDDIKPNDNEYETY